MKIQNICYFGQDNRFHFGDISIENGYFCKIDGKDGLCDGNGLTMIPGLIDIHLHGNSGCDFSNGDYEGLMKMATFLAKSGTTSFSPASMTLSEADLDRACQTGAKLRAEAPEGIAKLRGITMEGPFFNKKKKGAQNADYLRVPDVDMFNRLQAASGGLIKIACVAPELEGATAYIKDVGGTGVTVSAAHTAADYDVSKKAIESGLSHVTHLYNAMPPFLHRDPGLIGAACDHEHVTVELICDGLHIHESVVRATFKMFGAERICLISDAMEACGLPDGDYLLGGQKVKVSEGAARLADGTIAGSTATLHHCMKTAIKMGIAPEDAIRCATANPAKVLKEKEIGIIAEGKKADFLLCKKDWSLDSVYISGMKVKDK